MKPTTMLAAILMVSTVASAPSQDSAKSAESPTSLSSVSADFSRQAADATRKRDAGALDRAMRRFAGPNFVYISSDGRRLNLDQVRAANQSGFNAIARVLEYRMENGTRSETGSLGVIRRTWILRVEVGQPPKQTGQRITLEERWVRQGVDWRLGSIREIRRTALR